MSTRYIWETYSTKSESIISWGPDEHFYLESPNPNSGELDTELPKLLFAKPSEEGIANPITVASNIDSADWKTVDSLKYYKIDPYYEGEDEVTFENHPYVMYDDHTGEFSDYVTDLYEVVSCTFNIREEDDGSITRVISIFWHGQVSDTGIFPDTLTGHITDVIRDGYPDDGCIKGSDNQVWYKFIGSDNVSFDGGTIVFSVDSVPITGGYVTASFPEMDTSALVIPTDVLYNWYTSSDDGETWELYSQKTQMRKFTFLVTRDCTGFKIGITIDDGLGFESDMAVSRGIYIVENVPPSAPAFKNLPQELIIGNEFKIEWEESTDVDGVIFGYVVEKSINEGSWENIYQGGSLSFLDIANTGTETIQYRIRAYDDGMTYSEYTLSKVLPTKANTPPVISGENSNLGRLDSVDISYTVTDPGDTVTVVEYLDETILKTFTNIEGIVHRIMLEKDEIETLKYGTHLIKIVATDRYGASSVRTWLFKRSDAESSVTDAVHYQVYRKMEDGVYRKVRFENDTNNIIRVGENLNLEQSLDAYLPETSPTNDAPPDIGPGKIIVARNKLFAMGSDGDLIELVPERPPYIAQPTAPSVSDRDRIWIDTSILNNPIVKYWDGTKLKWVPIKSIYSGGTMDQ